MARIAIYNVQTCFCTCMCVCMCMLHIYMYQIHAKKDGRPKICMSVYNFALSLPPKHLVAIYMYSNKDFSLKLIK